MNTMGKILVILNFVFALVVGAFLTLKYATETNYKNTVDQLQAELISARKNNVAMTDTISNLKGQLDNKSSELESKKLEHVQLQAEKALMEADDQKKVKDSEDRAKASDVIRDTALAAQERMKKEIDGLKTVIEDREKRLVELHLKYKDSQDLVMSLDRDLKFSQERNQILIARVQELERFIAELQSGKAADQAAALPKDLTTPNPPQKYIKGVIEQVDSSDKSLVRVSLGTDHGLKVNNTLEVYRLSPSPEYVGMIRIVDTHHHTSVGRLVRAPGAGARFVREGDVVSSTLNPR